jgi:hypothetical protein
MAICRFGNTREKGDDACVHSMSGAKAVWLAHYALSKRLIGNKLGNVEEVIITETT